MIVPLSQALLHALALRVQDRLHEFSSYLSSVYFPLSQNRRNIRALPEAGFYL